MPPLPPHPSPGRSPHRCRGRGADCPPRSAPGSPGGSGSSGRSARTRQKVTSVVRAFWGWAEEQGHIAVSPAARIRRPRAERKVARVLPLNARPRLLLASKEPRDRLGLFCLLELGLRRAELARPRSCR